MTRRAAHHAQAIGIISREASRVCEAAKVHSDQLDDVELAMLIGFFKLLDRWDREVEHNAEAM